jgi:large subunit ribosomal protein L6
MSKIGNKPIAIDSKVNVEINGSLVKVKGPKGELSLTLASDKIVVEKQDNIVTVKRLNEDKQAKAMHGLYNSLITNMVKGVVSGYEIPLTLVGVGYRVSKKGNGLSFTLGYSHPVEFPETPGISFVCEGDTKVIVHGIDKQLVGQVAADIRKLRPPEPYKGKGVRYTTENVRRKAGKAGKK